jgi:serine/threonine protein kinase
MSECIKSVNGIDGDSSSRTDKWIVTFKDNVKYEHTPIKKGFVKMWLSHESVKYTLGNILEKYRPNYPINSHLINDIHGLDYEAKVYRDIVRELVDSNICPNFIRFLGLGHNCSFRNVNKMLVGVDNSQMALYRGAFSLIGLTTKGVSITSDLTEYIDREFNVHKSMISTHDILNNIGYNVLLNEVTKDGTVTFNDFPDKILGGVNIAGEPEYRWSQLLDKLPYQEVWCLIFQLIAAVYAMSLSGLCHNDLHLDNVYVEPCDEKIVTYIYEDQKFTFKTKYIVKVFDFDRSYCKRFGNNDSILRKCDQSQCNEYIPNLDAMKVMGGLYRHMYENVEVREKILHMCSPDDQIKNEKKQIVFPKKLLQSVWEDNNFLKNPITKYGMTSEDYEGFSSVFEILIEIGIEADICNSPLTAQPDNTYICNPDMFDINGKILNRKTSNPIDDERRIVELERQNTQLRESSVYEPSVRLSQLITSNKQLMGSIEENQNIIDSYENGEKLIMELELQNSKLKGELEDKVIILVDRFGKKCKPGQYVKKETGRCNNTRQLKPCGESQERDKKTNRCKKVL